MIAQKHWACGLTNFFKEVYCVWLGMRRMALPQGAASNGESTVVVMRANSCKLVHVRLTKPSPMSIAGQGASHFGKVRPSIITGCIVALVDNRWHAQFGSNPMKPNICQNVMAIVFLHTTPLALFLGDPSLQDLLDRGWHGGHRRCCT